VVGWIGRVRSRSLNAVDCRVADVRELFASITELSKEKAVEGAWRGHSFRSSVALTMEQLGHRAIPTLVVTAYSDMDDVMPYRCTHACPEFSYLLVLCNLGKLDPR
jgi:hypothetical protein